MTTDDGHQLLNLQLEWFRFGKMKRGAFKTSNYEVFFISLNTFICFHENSIKIRYNSLYTIFFFIMKTNNYLVKALYIYHEISLCIGKLERFPYLTVYTDDLLGATRVKQSWKSTFIYTQQKSIAVQYRYLSESRQACIKIRIFQ